MAAVSVASYDHRHVGRADPVPPVSSRGSARAVMAEMPVVQLPSRPLGPSYLGTIEQALPLQKLDQRLMAIEVPQR